MNGSCRVGPRSYQFGGLDFGHRSGFASATAQFAIAFNVSGRRTISVPAGLTEAGHSVGPQIGNGRFREDLMFALAGLCERTFP